MNKEQYLRRRIEDLKSAVLDESLPIALRKNQALALLNYKQDLDLILSEKANTL